MHGRGHSGAFAALGVLLFVLATAETAASQDSTSPRDKVFVTPVAGNLKPEVLDVLFDYVLAGVQRAHVVDKVTLQDVRAQLEHEKLKDQLSCNGVSCATEIAGALGVRYLLATTVKRFGGKLIVTMNLIDTREQKSRTGQGTCSDREEEYENAVVSAAQEAFGLVRRDLVYKGPGSDATPEPPRQEGSREIQENTPGASDPPEGSRSGEVKPLLSRQDVMDGVKKNAATVASCLWDARRTGEIPPRSYIFTLNWVIHPDGSVSRGQLKGPPEVLETSLPTCFANVMRNWRFPASQKELPISNFPFGPIKIL